MMKKNDNQINVLDYMIFEKLIPNDHLLVKVDSLIDFLFGYHRVKDKYSNIGRGSKDPVMMVKMILLDYLYMLSDVDVLSRAQTDIVFRWFLGLGLYDSVPDDTTISLFKVNRLSEKKIW